VPDFGFMTATTHPDKPPAVSLTWLEVDLASESNPVVLDKLWRYHVYSRSGRGRDRIQTLYRQFGINFRHHSFRLAVVVHNPLRENADDQRLAQFTAQALQLPFSTRNRIWITTAAALATNVNDALPLGAPVWIKLYDLRTHTADFRRFAATVDGTSRAEVRKRQYVERLLGGIHRHELLAATQHREASLDGIKYQPNHERLAQAI
jgi:hypothetical protein